MTVIKDDGDNLCGRRGHESKSNLSHRPHKPSLVTTFIAILVPRLMPLSHKDHIMPRCHRSSRRDTHPSNRKVSNRPHPYSTQISKYQDHQ
jgi:hypothetical protein